MGFMYFIAGYFRLHSRIVPRIAILLLYLFVFKIDYESHRDPKLAKAWLLEHGLGLWRCNFTLWIGALEYTNVLSISLAILTLLLCGGLEVTGPIGRSFTFLGSLAFAAYLIHEHPIWSEQLGDWWFRRAESIITPGMALFNGYRYTISVFLFSVAIDMYRNYFWERCVGIFWASWHTGQKIHDFLMIETRHTRRRPRARWTRLLVYFAS
jgi:hypothetical protein